MRSANPEWPKLKLRRGHGRSGLRSLVEAFTDIRSSIPVKDLGLVRFPCTLEQLDLLGASLFGNRTILGRNGIRINELLRRADAKPRRKDQDHADLQGQSSGRSTHRCGNPRGSHHWPENHHCFKTSRLICERLVRRLNNIAMVSQPQPASNFDR